MLKLKLCWICVLVVMDDGAGAIRMPSRMRSFLTVPPPSSLVLPSHASISDEVKTACTDCRNDDVKVTVPSSSNLICFVGATSMCSEPVPAMANTNDNDTLTIIKDFFGNKENRNRIFSDRANVRMVRRAQSTGDEDELLEIDSSVVGIKGLRVCATTVIDTQLQKSTSFQNLPAYTFELVDSRLSATGAAPLVWLFDNLVSRKITDKGEKTISTKSTTRVSCQPIVGGGIVFTSEARIQVSIRVPDYLLKLVSTKGIDEQGCQAIQGFLENEVRAALSRFRDAYLAEYGQCL